MQKKPIFVGYISKRSHYMKQIVLSLLFLITAQCINAQKNANDTVLFNYGKNTVTVQEFRKGLTKNEKPGDVYTEADIAEYLNLYKKFKLKVKDAYDQGIDTTEGFRSELSSYRKQIAKPYLTDRVVNDKLVNEAYQRMLNEVNASHILVFTKPDSSPEDTLAAFKKINMILRQIDSGKISFDDAAMQYSEDPTAKENKGGLGYFSAFQMIYEFENQAFNTPVGKISKVFRTEFGYHILKANDIRASRGEITVKHIMIQTNPRPAPEELAEAEAKINEVYNKLQKGDKFEILVQQYSEDANTVVKNGEIPAFSMTSSRLPENFKRTSFDLKNDGDYSKPILTSGGYHIIKRVSLKPIDSLKYIKPTILNKINRDSRQYQNTLAVYNKARTYYKVKENKKSLSTLQKLLSQDIVSGVYQHEVSKEKNKKQMKFVLFSLTKIKKAYTFEDFSIWLNDAIRPSNNKSFEATVKNYYEAYKMNTIMEFYENDLENINDSFASLYREYKEGILLFTLTDKKVWTKSVEDSVGLKAFYNDNASKYVFKDRYDATVIRTSTKAIAEQVKLDLEKGISLDSILRKQNRINPLNINTPLTGKFEKGDNLYADLLFNNSAQGKFLMSEDPKVEGNYVLIQVHQFIPEGKKSLNEARGLIISDYQQYLENMWIEEIIKKYPVTVNESALQSIKKQYVR
jgi:peptidyl-prolyl cis-trans isomerase SurA